LNKSKAPPFSAEAASGLQGDFRIVVGNKWVQIFSVIEISKCLRLRLTALTEASATIDLPHVLPKFGNNPFRCRTWT
jgi:hypothetical protein